MIPRLHAVCLWLATAGLAAATPAVDLRVDGWTSPLGLDDPRPRFSWRMEAGGSGAAQLAYQVRAASAADMLEQGEADLWDSGRVESAECLSVRYAGRPLESGQSAHWQVRLWDASDGEGEPGPWSAPARWTVGILDAADWNPGTRWITDASLLELRREKLGYRSREAAPADEKWVQLDLGRVIPLDRLVLRAVRHSVEERIGFPRRFRVEVADEPSFDDPRVVVAEKDEDFNQWIGTIDLPLDGVAARYLRFVATRLRESRDGTCLALSQVELWSQGENLAPQAEFSALDSIEDGRWSLDAINDGLGIPGSSADAARTIRLRREFTVAPGMRRAQLRLAGLGHYQLTLNGESIDADQLMIPGWTDYAKRCLYQTHDLSGHLREGTNVLGITLAGGFFNVPAVRGRYRKLSTEFRPLMAWGEIQLDHEGGRRVVIPTDERWVVKPGPTTFAHLFGGEDFDARLEEAGWASPGAPDEGWQPVTTTEGPGGDLAGTREASPPMRVHETLKVQNVRRIDERAAVHDFGQNASMMPRLKVRGPAGSVVRMIPAELVRDDGRVERGSAGGGSAWWQYTLRGDKDGESWSPAFFYHGARYLQVELEPADGGGALPVVESIEARVVHSDSASIGSFACSNDLFNRIHRLVWWAQRSNMAHVLTDCPHRERLGWLEQYHLNGPSLRYGWDLGRLYRKCFRDMAAAQQADGLVPNIAPEYVVFHGDFRDAPAWGSAIILAAWQHHLFTGELDPLRENLAAMQGYLDYLGSTAEGHIVDHGLGDWYDVGPKAPGLAQLTPVALTTTAIYYECARTLRRIAELCGDPELAAELGELAGEIGAAFNTRFLDGEKASYATGSQTALAMPLALGLVPVELEPRVLAGLVGRIEEDGFAVTAGDVGYRYVLRALAQGGRSDVVVRMLSQRERPGYAYQLDRGATSLTEAWSANRRNSQNHFMLGQVVEWFHHDLVGLQPDPAAPGWKHAILRPGPVDGVEWAEASHEGPYGRLSLRWERQGDRLDLSITVPPNTTATLQWPEGWGDTVKLEPGQHQLSAER